ncbi:MAG: hypothetical protein C4523_14250 [Myxococcales bacterium]|nr:MAG: hypothetical protein C4523_14250 [Myxococcales bacterium]
METNRSKQTSRNICLYRQLYKGINGGGMPQRIRTFPFSPHGALKALRAMRELHEEDIECYGNIGCGQRWLVVREAGQDVLDITGEIETRLGGMADGWVRPLGLESALSQEEMDGWLTYVEPEK